MAKSGPGFVKLYHAIMGRDDLSLVESVLFCVLADAIALKVKNGRPPCVALGQRLLAGKCKSSRWAVDRGLSKLCRLKLIATTTGGRGTRATYWMGLSSLPMTEEEVAQKQATLVEGSGTDLSQQWPGNKPPVAQKQATSGAIPGHGTDQTFTRLFPDNCAPAEKPPAKKRKKPTPKKPREPDPIWDAVVAEWFAAGVATSQRTRLGKLGRDLKDMGATPAGIRTARAAYRKEWPDAADTPEAIVKHWSRFAPTAPTAASKQAGPTLECLTAHPPLLALANRWPAEVQANAKTWRLIAELLVETHQWAVDEDVAKLATQAESEEQARNDCLERLRQTTAYQRRQGPKPGQSGASPDSGPGQSPPRESAGPRPAVRAIP